MGMVDKFCKKIGIGDTDDIDDLEREIRDDEQALQREQAEREARERLKMNDNVVDFIVTHCCASSVDLSPHRL